jgi:hypothetical protein
MAATLAFCPIIIMYKYYNAQQYNSSAYNKIYDDAQHVTANAPFDTKVKEEEARDWTAKNISYCELS